MKMTIGGTALAITLALSALAGTGAAANPNARLVLVTNDSHTCVRFDAIGVEDRVAHGDVHHPPQGSNIVQVGPYEKIDAAPRQTVRFEKIAADRAHVWAVLHVGDCHSPMSGGVIGPYYTQSPREHIAFEQTHMHTLRFVHVGFP